MLKSTPARPSVSGSLLSLPCQSKLIEFHNLDENHLRNLPCLPAARRSCSHLLAVPILTASHDVYVQNHGHPPKALARFSHPTFPPQPCPHQLITRCVGRLLSHLGLPRGTERAPASFAPKSRCRLKYLLKVLCPENGLLLETTVQPQAGSLLQGTAQESVVEGKAETRRDLN